MWLLGLSIPHSRRPAASALASATGIHQIHVPMMLLAFSLWSQDCWQVTINNSLQKRGRWARRQGQQLVFQVSWIHRLSPIHSHPDCFLCLCGWEAHYFWLFTSVQRCKSDNNTLLGTSMVPWVKVIRIDHLGSIPSIPMERELTHKLPADFHKGTMTCTCTHVHTHVNEHMYNAI